MVFTQSACSEESAQTLDKSFTESLASDVKISGLSIAKIDSGEISWTQNFGVREDSALVNDDTIFNVASLTKPVFSMLALRLVDEGKLDLDESLSKFWIDPDISEDPRHQKLTARLVLSHQTGLPNWRGNNKLSFMFSPGERHEYSGEGFEYLRRAIENKLGADINELAKKYVFAPAGMKSSSMGWNDYLGSNVAKGFDEKMGQIDTAIMEMKPNAAAHLMTTATDYARFLIWVSNGADLDANLSKEMMRPQAMHENPAERFGLGWKLVPLKSYDVLLHDGREPGVRTFAVIDPVSKEGIVILTNSSNGDLAYRTISGLALSYGESLWESTDRLVWNYLNSLPGQALVPMSKGIARSPAYLYTFLNAANTNLIQRSDLPQDTKSKVDKAISSIVVGLLNENVEPAQTEELLRGLIVEEKGTFSLSSGFSLDKAQQWVNMLDKRK